MAIQVIIVGSPATNRPNKLNPAANTILLRGAQANLPGVIKTIQFYLDTVNHADYEFYVGMFYNISGNVFKCRSAAYFSPVAVGLNTKSVSDLAIEAGDYIGYYHAKYGSYGSLMDITWGSGYMVATYAGNVCIEGAQATFSNWDTMTVSLRGVGETLPPAAGNFMLPLITEGLI